MTPAMGDDHAHAHAHSHAPGEAAPHSHAPSSRSLAHDPRARRALGAALGLGVVVLVVEVVAGLAFGSLALLGDAAHALTDVAAYAIALTAARIAARPASNVHTFGHGRVEILAALFNGASLLAASGWIAVEAMRRLAHPGSVQGGGVALVAAIGLVANLLVVVLLVRTSSDSLNVRGALLHAAGDALGSLAVLVSGIVVAVTGWERADPVVSLLLVALIVVGAWRLVRASVDQLLDAAPAGLGAEEVGSVLVAIEGVLEVHDVHVWSMSPGETAASAHVRIAAGIDPDATLELLQAELRRTFSITHSTLQLQTDRGAVPLEAVPLMSLEDAVDWTTEHIARANPDLSRAVIAAAAGAAALGFAGGDGRVSPVTLSSRTLGSLGRRPGTPPAS
ncbi:MAG: cation diffusion facilitator family transporter [Thermoleophilia bacterium]|nr:cation diffusion facilitator family transporter [Thermoleophilia bacterium]